MKKIGLALGIAGGVCALLAAAAVFCFLTLGPEGTMVSYGPWGIPPITYPDELDGLIFCLIIVASGVLGVAGGLLSCRHSVAGGVMMLIASLPNLSALPFTLLLLGCVFSQGDERSSDPAIANQNASMIKTARSCGIVGSIFAIICPVLILQRNVFTSDDGGFIGFNIWGRQLSLPQELMAVILAAAILAGVGLLLNAAVLVNRKAKTAGVLMLVGAILSLGTFMATILLLAGGIYALLADQSAVPTAEPKGERI